MPVHPSWQGIPINVKQYVVKLLDYKSRFRLRVCSKYEKSLVDNTPIHLKKVVFFVFRKESFEESFALFVNNDIRIKTDTVNHFIGLFKNKSSLVESVEFGCSRTNPISTVLTRETISAPNFEFRARKIVFYRSRDSFSIHMVADIFQNFDPIHLESIEIGGRLLLRWELAILANCELWKSVKNINICWMRESPIEYVRQMEKIRFDIEKIREEEVQQLINNFTSKKELSLGHGFLCFIWIPSVTQQQLPPVQHFKTHFEDLIFVVKWYQRTKLRFNMTGCVCGKENPDEDFEKFHIRVPRTYIRSLRHNARPLQRQEPPVQPVINVPNH